MLISFAAMAAGGVLIFRGIDVIDCQSVSFSGQFTTCYPHDLGALPGHVAGGGLIAVGIIVFFAAMLRLSMVK
ncbi:MAG: hypothetical protein HKN80_07035 [Acidimicrobiia bacterium]|nr:hypothetical protein [Acidimicrobiia bacterium]